MHSSRVKRQECTSFPVDGDASTRLTETPGRYNICVMLRVALEETATLTLSEKARHCKSHGDFAQVLDTLATLARAQGCVLWELMEFGSDERRFVALAASFAGELGWYYLPEKSYTGQAVESGVRRVVDLSKPTNEGALSLDRLREKGVTSICSIPVMIPGTGGKERKAAVNLYRHSGEPFSDAEVERLERLALFVPYVFDAVYAGIRLQLLHDVDRLLRTRGIAALRDVLELIKSSVGALECSVYLEDPLTAPNVYALKEQIWPWTWKAKPEYPDRERGMTWWTIRHGRTIRFLDLSHFQEERAIWKYEDVEFPNEDRLRKAAEQLLGSTSVPPLSFVCVPIKFLGRTIGALRCCLTEVVPHLFGNAQIKTLELIADQIGERWGADINTRRAADEKRLFGSFAQQMDRHNSWFFLKLREGTSTQRQFQQALRLLSEGPAAPIVPDASSVRLLDPTSNELYVVASAGKVWNDGKERLKRRVPASADTAEGRAILDEKIIRCDAVGPGNAPAQLMPEATRYLHAPIIVDENAIGVVDFFGLGVRPFAPSLDAIARLFAQQLGLHHKMHEQFHQLTVAHQKLGEQYEQHLRIYEDFQHQLGSAVVATHKAAQSALKAHPHDPLVRATRSHARRAENVANNIKYFSALVRDELKVERGDLIVLTADELVARLTPMADDQELLATKRRIRFEVDVPSFERLHFITARAHPELLQQVMMNLLDNASKYSDPGSTVMVRGDVDHRRTVFRLSVLNRGFRVSSAERPRLTERGYRGDAARLENVNGQGIGLYIVDEFMKAMDGNLDIVPTDDRGLNEFTLVFPAIR